MALCLNSQCSHKNIITAKFCAKCGKRLLVQDRYRALKIIGQGGFGKTFLAQDEAKPSQPKCVIKQFLYTDPVNLKEAQRLFEQEAIRLDDLGKHPQIPELLAHVEQEGQQYLVQEFIDGVHLAHELKSKGAFSEAKIVALLLDLLPVLQFIHADKVIHRDIKPENIIRRRKDGRLVLVDFGSAKVATQTAWQKTGTTIGSVGYTALEQTLGKAIFASDIYSLGVTCLNLLTNVEPFIMYDPIDGIVWRRFLLNRTVSNRLGQILDKMTQPNARERYQTVEEILQILKRSLRNQQPNPASLKPQVAQFLSQTPAQNAQPQSTDGNNSLILDCGNDVKLELVKIPTGKFMMGANSEEKDASSYEYPQHEVQLNEFYIGKYAVTQEQWQAVMGNNPSRFKGKNLPVETVSWHEARKFCQKLAQMTGYAVRLPTEAEWEYACRSGTQTPFYFGNTINTNQANYDGTHPYGDTTKGESRECTVDVDIFQPNAWGLYQMHGNVWEWCLDEWHDSYSDKPEHLKQNGNEVWGYLNVNEHDNRYRLLRGGSWYAVATNCRSADRSRGYADNGYFGAGFRLVV